jgi:hypothetical protein
MELITREQFALLLLNGANNEIDSKENLQPVIKLSNPASSETWLVASVNPDDPDKAYCLYNSGEGLQEYKNISIENVVNYQGTFSDKKVERVENWIPSKSLAEYFTEAQKV